MTSDIGIDPIIRTNDLVRLLGIHKTTLWRWVQAGEFPEPLRMNRNTIGWRISTIEAWLESCEVTRDD